MQFLMVMSTLSLNTFLLKYYFDCKSTNERSKLIGNIFISLLGYNILLFAVLYYILPLIIKAANINIPFNPYFSLSLGNNFFEVFSIIPLIIYRVKEDAKSYIIINSLRAIGVFAVTYVLIVKLNYGILGSFYGKIIVNGLFLIPFFSVIIKNSKINFNFRQLLGGLKFSLPLLPGAFGYLLLSMSDRIILERYVSLSDIGIYSVAYTLAFSLSIVTQSGYRSFEPEIFKRYLHTDFKDFINKLHAVFMFTVLLFATVLSIFSKEVLSILTSGDFINGFKIIPLILVGIIAMAQNAILGSLVIAEGKTKLSSSATIIGGSCSIVLNIFIIPYYGIYCAAISSGIAFIIMNFIIYYYLDFKTKFFFYDLISIVIFFIVTLTFVIYLESQKISFINILLLKCIVTLALLFVFKYIYALKVSNIKYLISKKTK
jgi:O-antigen/teichoic acid export membrane protein